MQEIDFELAAAILGNCRVCRDALADAGGVDILEERRESIKLIDRVNIVETQSLAGCG